MMAVWIALAFLLAGVVLGLLYVVFRGLALWRHVKRAKAAFGAESARIAEVTADIQGQLDRASGSSARLGETSARLAVARARLAVQLEALREARHTVRRLLWFLPGT